MGSNQAEERSELARAPFRHRQPDEVLSDAQTFAKRESLKQYFGVEPPGAWLLQRGALEAKTPGRISKKAAEENEAAVENEAAKENDIYKKPEAFEDAAFRKEEKGHFKDLTKDAKIFFATCALGAFLQGWSQEAIVGANLQWPHALGLTTSSGKGSLESLHGGRLKIFSLVTAMPYFAASLFGTFISDPVAHKFGRRWALFLAALCTLAGSVGSAGCSSWEGLAVCRFVLGVGMGAKSSIIPVMESEVCPPKIRGKIMVSWQASVATGIFSGAAFNWIFQNHWQMQIAGPALPTLPLLFLCFVIPETPQWLITKGKYGEAFYVLTRLRETRLQAARDLFAYYVHYKTQHLIFHGYEPDIAHTRQLTELFQETEEEENAKRNERGLAPNFYERFFGLFTIPRNRHAVLAASVVMASQQFCAINIFAFLCTSVFDADRISNTANLGLNFGFGTANAASSFLAFYLIGRFGRQKLLVCSLVLMFPFLLATGGTLSTSNHGHGLSTGLKVGTEILIVAYTIMYGVGAGPIPFMYSSEVFPLVYREVGMSFACFVNLGLAGIVAFVVPIISNSLEQNYLKVLATFAGLDAFAAIAVWLVMRAPEEADSLSFDDIDILFCKTFKEHFEQHVWPFGKDSGSTDGDSEGHAHEMNEMQATGQSQDQKVQSQQRRVEEV